MRKNLSTAHHIQHRKSLRNTRALVQPNWPNKTSFTSDCLEKLSLRGISVWKFTSHGVNLEEWETRDYKDSAIIACSSLTFGSNKQWLHEPLLEMSDPRKGGDIWEATGHSVGSSCAPCFVIPYLTYLVLTHYKQHKLWLNPHFPDDSEDQ